MQDFVQGGLHWNAAIATAFMHFLAKRMVGGAAAGGRGQSKTLTDKVKKMQTAVLAATTTAKDAAKDAKEASARASTANTKGDAAKNAVDLVYSKNPTLKR
jgi:hypothetical protein